MKVTCQHAGCPAVSYSHGERFRGKWRHTRGRWFCRSHAGEVSPAAEPCMALSLFSASLVDAWTRRVLDGGDAWHLRPTGSETTAEPGPRSADVLAYLITTPMPQRGRWLGFRRVDPSGLT